MPAKFIDFASLKESVTIVQALDWLGIQLKQEPNGQLRGPCPIHGGKNQREFVVTPSKGLFFCFAGCGGGDMLKLVAHVRKIGTREAAEEVVQHFGKGTVPQAGNSRVQEAGNSPRNSASAEPPEFKPLDYLEPRHEALAALPVPAEVLEQFGAGFAPKGILRGRLAIPIHTKTGKLIAYTGRALGEEQPRLLFPRDFNPRHVVWNAHRMQKGDLVYVASDPLQALQAAANGVDNVVSFLSDITSDTLQALSVFMDEFEVPNIELLAPA